MADTEQPAYLVEAFLQERKTHILVHWKDWDKEEDHTWEPKKQLMEDLGSDYFYFLAKMVTAESQRMKKFTKN